MWHWLETEAREKGCELYLCVCVWHCLEIEAKEKGCELYLCVCVWHCMEIEVREMALNSTSVGVCSTVWRLR